MKLKEGLARDRTVWKRLKGKSRLLFLWDYYRIPILALAALIALGSIAAASAARHAPVALYAVFVNAAQSETARDPAALETLLTEGGVDMRGKRAERWSDLTLGRELDAGDDGQTVQLLSALFLISDLDFFASDPASFAPYAAQGSFADLSVLIEPELWQNRPDADLIWHEDSGGLRSLQGIVLHDGSPLHTAGYFSGDTALGAAARGENLEAAVALIRRILQES